MDRIMIIKIKGPIESSKSIHLLMFHIDPKFSLKCVNDSGDAGNLFANAMSPGFTGILYFNKLNFIHHFQDLNH